MAKKIKVYSDDIERISKEIDKLIETINQDYNNLEKNKTLISEAWKSAAAIKMVDNISKENKNLKSALKEVTSTKDYVNKTTKNVLQADEDILKKIKAIL